VYRIIFIIGLVYFLRFNDRTNIKGCEIREWDIKKIMENQNWLGRIDISKLQLSIEEYNFLRSWLMPLIRSLAKRGIGLLEHQSMKPKGHMDTKFLCSNWSLWPPFY